MAYTGALEQTKSQIAEVLNLSQNDQINLNFYNQTQNLFNSQSDYLTVNQANKLWLHDHIYRHKDIPDKGIKEDFLQIQKKYFQQELQFLDFTYDRFNAEDIINNWVKNQTNNHIQNIIPKNGIHPYSQFILTSALYFKANWINSFNPSDTFRDKFYLPKSNKNGWRKHKRTFFMEQTSKFNYLSTDKFQAVELDYQGDLFSMVIVLPNDNYSLQNFINNMDKGFIKQLNSNLTDSGKQMTNLILPKFELEYSENLIPTLQQLGIKDAFSEQSANFKAIADWFDDSNIFINDFIHKTKLEIDETGSEASSASLMSFNVQSSDSEYIEIQQFLANRPFFFYIKDNKFNNTYFMGTYTQPTELQNQKYTKNDL